MGFYFTGEESEPKPLCVICNEVFANSSLKPLLFCRHLETKHPTCKDKPIEYFKRKLIENRKCTMSSFLSALNEDSKMALETSFQVSYTFVRFGQAHTENLTGPYAKDIRKYMLEEKGSKKESDYFVKKIVLHRINDLANNVESEHFTGIKLNYFGIQLDKLTDVINTAVLLVYFGYIFKIPLKEIYYFQNL